MEMEEEKRLDVSGETSYELYIRSTAYGVREDTPESDERARDNVDRGTAKSQKKARDSSFIARIGCDGGLQRLRQQRTVEGRSLDSIG